MIRAAKCMKFVGGSGSKQALIGAPGCKKVVD